MGTTGTAITKATSGPGISRIYGVLFSPFSMRLALGVLLVSFVLPAHGLGIEVCWFKLQSGLPCPGCGLTRSLTNISHLHLRDAAAYNPFGLVVWPLVAVLAASNFIGEQRRLRIRRWLGRRDRAACRLYLGLVYAFIAFGLARLAVAASGHDLFSNV